LIDVREGDEHAQGAPADDPHPARLSRAPDREERPGSRDADRRLRERHAIAAARSLAELGYTNQVARRWFGWKRAGLAWGDAADAARRSRDATAAHAAPRVGAGQLKLLASKVLCIGAGGRLAVEHVPAAAGIGTIGVIDDDVVDASNLQRQILHGTDRLGKPKVDSAEETLTRLNPDVKVDKHRTRLTSANVLEILARYDVVIDGADNFATRYLVNDAALKLAKPVIHASIFRFEGQITVFPANGSPCYRCLYPEPPPAEDAPSCAEAGVLPGTGRAQATGRSNACSASRRARRPARRLRRDQDAVPRAQAAPRSQVPHMRRRRRSLGDSPDRLRAVLQRSASLRRGC
jgi:molybdopterin/thiamine biosynthesis adenylyltransferase